MQSQPLHSDAQDRQEIRLKQTRLEREYERQRLEKLRAKLRIQLRAADYRPSRLHPAA